MGKGEIKQNAIYSILLWTSNGFLWQLGIFYMHYHMAMITNGIAFHWSDGSWWESIPKTWDLLTPDSSKLSQRGVLPWWGDYYHYLYHMYITKLHIYWHSMIIPQAQGQPTNTFTLEGTHEYNTKLHSYYKYNENSLFLVFSLVFCSVEPCHVWSKNICCIHYV